MAKIMTLPKIGVNMTEAVIERWAVKPGDTVHEGDLVLVAETDKATQDIFATETGVVGKLMAAEGDKVLIHEPLVMFLAEGEAMDEEAVMESAPEAPKTVEAPAAAAPTAAVQTPAAQKDRIRISPLARKLAKELGMDERALRPQKPGCRIVKKDVLAFSQAVKESAQAPVVPAAPPAPMAPAVSAETIPFSATRRIIAERMLKSTQEKPSAALTLTVSAHELVALRESYKRQGYKISYNDLIVKAVATALGELTYMNSVLTPAGIEIQENINVGVAVDSEKGLMVPVIRDADLKSVRKISAEFADKAAAIRENRISSADLTGGTFTVTNLGMFEIEQFTPIINPPECAILAVGAIKKMFVPDEHDQAVLRETMQLTLVFDHRIVDGAPAARFLQRVKQYLECPMLML